MEYCRVDKTARLKAIRAEVAALTPQQQQASRSTTVQEVCVCHTGTGVAPQQQTLLLKGGMQC